MKVIFKSQWPQIVRRVIQCSVLFFVIYAAAGTYWRNYKLAHNQARLVGLIHGDYWGQLYAANESMLSLMGESYGVSLNFLGMPWAATIFGVPTTDPTLVLSTIFQTGELSAKYLLALLVPVLLALICGKVFCSHLCPMRLMFDIGQLIRNGLVRLRLPLPLLRPKTRIGGWILLGGMVGSMLSSTAIWLYILPYVSLSAGIFLLVTTASVSILFSIAVFWFFLDILVAPGFFCHSLCPTGFLLEKLGSRSWFRLRKDSSEPCPVNCHNCINACPYDLSPKTLTHVPACNNCGSCVPACPGRKLSRGFGLTLTLLLVCGLPALAHHNKGLPHYGYFENYPQVPTEEYVVIQGRWEMGASVFNFQGLQRRDADTPNDVKIFCYIYDLEKDQNYKDDVYFEVRLDGEVIATYDRVKVDEESIYSTRETVPKSGVYELVAHLGGKDGFQVIMPFEVDLADGGVNWFLLLGFGLPVLLAFLLALHGHQRRRFVQARQVGAALFLLGFAALGAIPARATEAHPFDSSPDLTWSALAFQETGNPDGTSSAKDVICPDCGMTNCTMDHREPVSSSNGPVCEKCGMISCDMNHYETEHGTEVMVMGGIPTWLFLAGIVAILVLSFVATEWFAPKQRFVFRRNLIKKRGIYNLVRHRWFQAVPQIIMVVLLVFLLYAGLFGSRVYNITPVAVWTIWWAGLIFAVALVGPMFCFACPWDGLTNLMTRLRFAARVPPLNLGLSIPEWLKNMYPAITLFVVLTWLELGFGVTNNPRTTAYMGIGMAALAVFCALLFDGKAFCRYACPVGRISGIYANFSPVEIRARNPRTCAKCVSEDCLHGNERGYPCPVGISLKTVTDSTYCTLCTECIKSCDKYNVAFNLRPFAADLTPQKKTRMDEAWMCLVLLALTLFHGFSMTPAWENFAPGGTSFLKWMATTFSTPKFVNFTIGMLGIMAIPILLYWLCCWLAAKVTRGAGVLTRDLFCQYAFSLLPVALFYHLAHNAMHLFMEGGEIIPMLSDPLGNGSNYWGTAGARVGSLIPEGPLWQLQVGLILVGHLIGILVAHRIGHRLFSQKSWAVRSLVPMLVMMVLLSVAGLGLMHMDMNMRVGRM